MELKKKNWNDALFYAAIIYLICFFMSKMITSSWHPDSYSTLEKLTNFAHWVIPSFGAALASFFLIKNGDADSVKRIVWIALLVFGGLYGLTFLTYLVITIILALTESIGIFAVILIFLMISVIGDITIVILVI